MGPMTTVATRVLAEDEHRAANDLFRAALHVAPATDDEWARLRPAYQPGRTLGATTGPGHDALAGTARSVDAALATPDGGTVPLAAVTGVGVRADRTRRGVLTELMRAQLTDAADRGVTAAALYATEGGIYGRFGYGVATRSATRSVDRRTARLRPDVPTGGDVELLDLDTAVRRLPDLYATLPARPGTMTRPAPWWAAHGAMLRRGTDPVVTAVHHGPHGPDGFVTYRVGRDGGEQGVLRVLDLHTAGADAFAGLWRYLLGVDLVAEIRAPQRPRDEPVELLLTDPRTCRVTEVTDELWARPVDVPAVLRSLPAPDGDLVLGVHDPLLPDNTGHYRVSPEGVERTDGPAGLRLGVDALAAVWLGDRAPSELARVGAVTVGDAATAGDVLARADTLVGARRAPWCGTFF